MAQSIAACQHLVGPERSLHQFHCHFLRPGDCATPLRFETEKVMDGSSFSVVHVRALQDESPILAMTCSLQRPEKGLEHQCCRGGIPSEWGRPAELKSLQDHMVPFLDRLPEKMRPIWQATHPIEIRPNNWHPSWDETQREPIQINWIRARALLPDDLALHMRLLTYISDWGILEVSLFPHAVSMWDARMQVASLSHAMHFHQPFRLDRQWLCHVMRSPVSSGGRGLTFGEFWSEDGVLIASTLQEGLIRQHRGKPVRSK